MSNHASSTEIMLAAVSIRCRGDPAQARSIAIRRICDCVFLCESVCLRVIVVDEVIG